MSSTYENISQKSKKEFNTFIIDLLLEIQIINDKIYHQNYSLLSVYLYKFIQGEYLTKDQQEQIKDQLSILQSMKN